MRRLLAHAAVLGVLLAAAACGGGGDSGNADADVAGTAAPATGGAPAQTRPPRTEAPVSLPGQLDPEVLLDLLPKAKDVGSLELAIPTVTGLRDMAIAQADSTGPCGAALTWPALDAAAGRQYESVKGRIIALAIPRDEAVDAFVAANLADLTAGCASHTTTGTDGSDLSLSGPEAVDVSATNPEGVAWLSTIEQPAGAGQRAVVMLPSTNVTVLVSMDSIEPIDAAYVQELANVFYAKVGSAV